ncbi:hypothetical protein [Calothrix sp. NIES-2098]|uniref:hypothetical protein n=1 Tax=Calothrix sp. NIES-2098 TaxID=1954171 RepID=UPI000B6060EC|nr:hypothetical protein NIES2098_47240 [Calothrix sp. NIES-2098]
MVNTSKKVMANNPKVSATVESEVRDYLAKLAAEEDRTISYIVARALTQYVESIKKERGEK